MMLDVAYITLAFLAASLGDIASHWSFDAIEDGEVVDHIQGLNAEVNGAVLQQGALHGCLYFDGLDDYASVESIGAVQKILGNLGEGTISAWFRFDHSPGFMDIETIFYLGAEEQYSVFGSTTDGFELEVGHFSAQRRLYWTLITTEGDDTSVPFCWSTTEHLDTSRWYHIVSTVSESEGTHVYLNNVEILDSNELTWNFGDESMCRFFGDVLLQEVLWFGKGLWDNEHKFYEGAIDEVKIWSRAITAEEVHAEYERIASVGQLEINPSIPDEIIVVNGISLFGVYENIAELGWRIDDGDFTLQQIDTIESNWSIDLLSSEVPAGRHEIKVLGRNAARRAFIDSRIIIQPDLNGDDIVNIADLLMLIDAWGECECPEDLTGNGQVGVNDLLFLIGQWS